MPRKVNTTIIPLIESDDNKFIDNLICDISIIPGGIMRTTIKDKDDPHRWNVNDVPGFLQDIKPDPYGQLDSVGFNSTTQKGEEFAFTLTDQLSGKNMLNTSNQSFIYTDKYIEYGVTLPTQVVFGLGPHNSKFLLEEGNWTMHNTDHGIMPPANGEGRQSLYGTNPFLMAKTLDNKFEGILFYNSNPQQFYVEFIKTGESVITFRTIGGILDIYFLSADTVDNVIKQYVELIGMPSLPPFWSLGFHQCSWGYSSTQKLKDVVGNYTSQGYMFDSIWIDINYMEDYIDFTVGDTDFAGLKELVENLHNDHLHFVPVLDAGISIKTDSKGINWYNIGNEMNVFIKTAHYQNLSHGNLLGVVWPGYTAYIDFFSPNSTEFWGQGLQSLYEQVPYDGIWLDMNEPTNL